LIVAISVPAILLVMTLAVADENGGDIEDTWRVWVLFLGLVGYFEFKLFSHSR
jgi:hypothetical protein